MPGVGQICKICRARSCFADAGMGEKGGTEDWSERLFWRGTLQGPGGMGFGVRRSKAQVRWGLERDAPRPRGDGVWSETLQSPGEMGFGARGCFGAGRSKAQGGWGLERDAPEPR